MYRQVDVFVQRLVRVNFNVVRMPWVGTRVARCHRSGTYMRHSEDISLKADARISVHISHTGINNQFTRSPFSLGIRTCMFLLACMLLPTHPRNVLASEIEAIYAHRDRSGSVELTNVPTDPSFLPIVTATLVDSIRNSVSEPAVTLSPVALAQRVQRYQTLVSEVAQSTNLDPKLLHALIAVESGYNPQAVSRAGAVGLMQLMPATARRYGIQNSHDPLQNITGGARYLRDLLKMFNNDLPLVLAAYNAGEHAVLRHGRQIPPFKETIAYVPKVLALYKKLELITN
jgi:hypothetical protein